MLVSLHRNKADHLGILVYYSYIAQMKERCIIFKVFQFRKHSRLLPLGLEVCWICYCEDMDLHTNCKVHNWFASQLKIPFCSLKDFERAFLPHQYVLFFGPLDYCNILLLRSKTLQPNKLTVAWKFWCFLLQWYELADFASDLGYTFPRNPPA